MRKLFQITLLVAVLTVILALFLYRLGPSELMTPQKQLLADPPPKSPRIISPLTLEQFYDENIATNEYPADEILTIVVTGDIIPGRSVNYKTIAYNNFHWAFEPTATFLRDADLTYVNLESPIISQCPITNEGMIFCGDARHVQGLVYAGVDVANLANNHLGNQGVEGIKETIRHLSENKILASGAENNPQYITSKGVKIAFLGYDDVETQVGVSKADILTIQQEVREAKENSDLVIVQFHWGVEYVSQPTDRQQELGKVSIDSGADIVIGNHPHWIQPIEIYNGKLITYAHGNFIFDQMWSEKTKEGVVGKYYFYNNQLIDAEYIPIKIEDYGQAHIISDEDTKKRILDSMYKESVFLQHKIN